METKGKKKKIELQPVLKYPEDLPEGVCVMSGYTTDDIPLTPAPAFVVHKKEERNEN